MTTTTGGWWRIMGVEKGFFGEKVCGLIGQLECFDEAIALEMNANRRRSSISGSIFLYFGTVQRLRAAKKRSIECNRRKLNAQCCFAMKKKREVSMCGSHRNYIQFEANTTLVPQALKRNHSTGLSSKVNTSAARLFAAYPYQSDNINAGDVCFLPPTRRTANEKVVMNSWCQGNAQLDSHLMLNSRSTNL